MGIFGQHAKVRAARAEMLIARSEFNVPATALLTRAELHPLTMVSAAAGVGFVLGKRNVHPLRVPGVSSLLGGGFAEAVTFGTRLLSDMGAFDFFSSDKSGTDKNDPGVGDSVPADQESDSGQPS